MLTLKEFMYALSDQIVGRSNPIKVIIVEPAYKDIVTGYINTDVSFDKLTICLKAHDENSTTAATPETLLKTLKVLVKKRYEQAGATRENELNKVWVSPVEAFGNSYLVVKPLKELNCLHDNYKVVAYEKNNNYLVAMKV